MITVCIAQTEKVEFPAYASPSHCSSHLRLRKVNFAKTWVSFGELFDTPYWRASALFESCLLFLFHALYLSSLFTPWYQIIHSSHGALPVKEGKVILPSATVVLFVVITNTNCPSTLIENLPEIQKCWHQQYIIFIAYVFFFLQRTIIQSIWNLLGKW